VTTEQSVERLGSELHFWVTGPTDGPVVAFTHGASLDHRSFDAQLWPLVDKGFRVLTWDMRGHGRSKPLGAEFAVSTLATDFATIVDQVGCEQATVVGHSMGGYVARSLLTGSQTARVGSSSSVAPTSPRPPARAGGSCTRSCHWP
jgi:pimeloyl-ACP methyl ester carboxylesterase